MSLKVAAANGKIITAFGTSLFASVNDSNLNT